MRLFTKIFAIASIGMLMAGSVRLTAQDVSVDYDHNYKFDMMKGYSWGKIQATDPLLEPRLGAAVDHILQGYGFKESAKTGNQAVDSPKQSVLIVTAVEAKDPQQYAAFYRGMTNLDWHRGWGSHGFSDSVTSLRQIHGGTLVIDLYDGPTGKLVWRGTAAEGNVANEKKSQDDVDKEVAGVFANFPPKSGGPLAPNETPVLTGPATDPRTSPN